MQALIDDISTASGVDATRVAMAVGVILNLIQTQGDKASVACLFAMMPDAETLASRSGSSGGLMDKMAGGMMGGPLAAIAKMQASGISMDNNKFITARVLEHARLVAGDKLVRAAAANIPGLSGYL